MDELSQRVQEYQQAVRKRDDVIAQLSTSLQSTILQRDELRTSAQDEARRFAGEILVLKQQLQQTSALFRNKEFAGINAAEFVKLKNQLIASDADNNNKSDQIADLKAELETNTKRLVDCETSSAQLQSIVEQQQEDLVQVRAQVSDQRQQLDKYHADLASLQAQSDLERAEHGVQMAALQQRLQQAQQEKGVLEESFTKEISQLESRLDLYSTQLSERSLLDESLSATQRRVSELTSQLESTATQLQTVSEQAAKSEAQLRQKVAELEEQLRSEREVAGGVKERLTTDLEERFGHQISQITSELRSVHAAELDTLRQQHASDITNISADHESSLDQLHSQQRALREQRERELAATTAELVLLGNDRQQLLETVERLRRQLPSGEEVERLRREVEGFKEKLRMVEEERNGLVKQVQVTTDARDALTSHLRVMSADCNALQQKLAVLADENMSLQQQMKSATEELSSHKQDLAKSREERDAASQQAESLTEERDSLAKQLQSVLEERDTLTQRLEVVSQVRVQAGSQLTEANQHRDQLCQALAATNQQRDELSRQLSLSNHRQTELEAQIETLQRQCDLAAEKLASKTKHCGELVNQLNTVNQQREHLNQQLVESSQQQVVLSQQLTEISQQRDVLASNDQRLVEAIKQRDVLAQRLNGMTLDKDSVSKQLKSAIERTNELDADLSKITREMDIHHQQNIEMTEQRDSLQQQLTTMTERYKAVESELRRASQNRDNLSAQLKETTEQRDALSLQLATLHERAEETTAIIQRYTEDVSRHQAQSSLMQAELARVQTELSSQMAERTRLTETLQRVAAERDGLIQTLDMLTGDRVRLAEALETATGEQARLTAQLEAAGKDQTTRDEVRTAELSQQLTVAQTDIASLQEQLRELAAREVSARERLSVVEAERAQTRTQIDSLNHRLAELNSSEETLRGSLRSAEADLASTRDELATVSASEAALRSEVESSKDSSNTVIKLRARAEATSRRLEDAERRVSELEKERDMLRDTHERYVREVTAQMAAAEAEVEKLRTCLLLQGVTSPPRRTSVSSPRKGSIASSEKDGVRSPLKGSHELLISPSFASLTRTSPRRELFAASPPTKETNGGTAVQQREIQETVAETRHSSQRDDCENMARHSSVPAGNSEATTQRSAQDSGLTTLSGTLETNSHRLTQLESLILSGMRVADPEEVCAVEAVPSPPMGSPRVSGNVAELVTRLSQQLSEAVRLRRRSEQECRRLQKVLRKVEKEHHNGKGESTVSCQQGEASREGTRSSLAKHDTVNKVTLEDSTNRQFSTQTNNAERWNSAAHAAAEAARHVVSVLSTSEQQESRLEALETRVADQLTSLRREYKSTLKQDAGSAANIVLIDSSYEVKLLKAKLEACSSINVALRTQMRQHRQLLRQFQNLFSAVSEDWERLETELAEGDDGGNAPAGEGRELGVGSVTQARDTLLMLTHGLDSPRDSLPLASARDDAPLSDPGVVSVGSPCLRDAPASARSLQEGVLTEPLLLRSGESMKTGHSSVIWVDGEELLTVADRSEDKLNIPEEWDDFPLKVPAFDSRLFRETCQRDGEHAFHDVVSFQKDAVVRNKEAEAQYYLAATPSASPRKVAADTSLNSSVQERWRELPGSDAFETDSPVKNEPSPTSGSGSRREHRLGQDDEHPPDSPLTDAALLESLVRENGTLRRALMYEKERAQRLLSASDENRGRCDRAAAALRAAEQGQQRLLDCVQRQQDCISRLQRCVSDTEPGSVVPDLSEDLQRCRDSLGAHAETLVQPADAQDSPKTQESPQDSGELTMQLQTRKQQLDEANQLLQLRDKQLNNLQLQRQTLSRECSRLRRDNEDLLNRLAQTEATLAAARAGAQRGNWIRRKLQTDVSRAELVMDLERALWQVESRHQLMVQEQRLYQHFLTALPSSTEGTPTCGPSPEPAREVWLFPVGDDHPGSPRLREPDSPRLREPSSPRLREPNSPRLREPKSPPLWEPSSPRLQGRDAAGTEEVTSEVQVGASSQTRLQEVARVQTSGLLLANPNLQAGQEVSVPLAPFSSSSAAPGVADCPALLEKLDLQLQAEFHRMVQAVSVRWTRRSLEELLRSQTQDQPLDEESLQKAQERLHREVREVKQWLEDTYSQVIAELQTRLGTQRQQLIQAEAEVHAKANSLAEDPHMVNEALQSKIKQLQERVAEARERQQALEERVKSHEQEVNDLREYFQEKVKFTEKMYSDEIRRLIQQHALAEAGVSLDGGGEPPDGVRSLAEELGGSLTDFGLSPSKTEDSVGPSVLRLRVEYERRVATLRQGLERKLAARTRDVTTELERKHRQEIAEVERKHMVQLAQTVERYKSEAEAARRQAESQGSAAHAQLVQQHQLEIRRLKQQQPHQEQATGAGGGDGPGADVTSSAEDGGRQLLLSDLESLAQQLRQQHKADQAILSGVSLDEDAAARVARLQATLQRDASAGLAELDAAHQAALRALEQRHQRQQRELQLQLEAAARRERRLQETLSEELEALQERLGSELLDSSHFGEGISLELDGLRLQLRQLEQASQRVQDQLWSSEDAPTVEVAREELQLLHRDREEQTQQLQQLTSLVRALCQYYHTAERIYRPPSGPHSTEQDPEAEATDRMVLAALAPDEGVSLWAETGRQLPRVERCVREAAARLQAAASQANGCANNSERLQRSEQLCAELQLRVDGLASELVTARQQLASAQHRLEERAGEEREALGEAGGEGRELQPGVALQHIRDAAEALLSAPADAADSGLLLSRVHQLETLVTELTTQSDLVVAECNREVDDVRQQMEAADKQLRATRSFLEEVTAEREAERDEFNRDQARLATMLAETERERDEQALRRRQLESVEVQNNDLLAALHDSEEERSRLRDEVKAAVDKIYDLRDIIRSLENQVDELGQQQSTADGAQRLRQELHHQAETLRQLQQQLAECRCGDGDKARPSSAPAADPSPPPAVPALNSTADSEDTVLSVCPSLLQELREQIIRMETRLDQRVEVLESSHSSQAGTLSPATSQQDVRHASVGEELGQLRRKLQRLAAAEEVAFSRVTQLETEMTRCRSNQQDLSSERDALQQQSAAQLLQISELQARLQRSRLAAEAGAGAADAVGGVKQRVKALQRELDRNAAAMRSKEKQLAELVFELEQTRGKLQVREAELSRLSRQQLAATTADAAAAENPATEQLRALQEQHRTLQLRHQELLAQLRENNLPEFVEHLLAEKNQQIDDLQLSLSQSQRSASAGDRISDHLEVLDPSLLSGGGGGSGGPSPEVLRHVAATSATSDPADLSRPDLSLVGPPDKLQDAPAEPAAGSRPDTPSSEHSFGSAPTVAGSEAGGRSSAGSRATSARTSSSGESIHQLHAALARKKQLLTSRKQQMELERQQQLQAQIQDSQASEPGPPPSLDAPVADLPADAPVAGHPENASAVAQADEAQQQLEQLQARLNMLNPILAQLDSDYTDMVDSVGELKVSPRSQTELALMQDVQELRRTIQQQEALHQQLQQHLHQLHQKGVPGADPLLRSVEEQLLETLRDMELMKLDACSKMHETSALLARHHRQAQQEVDNDGSDPASSSGYMSMSPRLSTDEPTASEAPLPPLPPPPPPPVSPHPSTLPWLDDSSAMEETSDGAESESESGSAFVSVSQRSHRTERLEATTSETGCSVESEDPGCDEKSSCPSLLDGMSDVDAEVERLRDRISELERQLGHRGDAPSPVPDVGQWRDRLEQERSAWSRERQRLQLRIERLQQRRQPEPPEQRLRGDGDLQRRCLRAESHRRALCWQKRYLMVLLGGYQETEVMTLERMTKLTGGQFQPDGRLYLRPVRKFRAAVLALVALHRMHFMVNRWRPDRRLAATTPATDGRDPGTVPRTDTQVRPPTPASCASDSSQMATAELSTIDRLVRECTTGGSTPELTSCHLDTRSVASVSDVCTEDLEPYLARFDALLDRQGLPPQAGQLQRR